MRVVECVFDLYSGAYCVCVTVCVYKKDYVPKCKDHIFLSYIWNNVIPYERMLFVPTIMAFQSRLN